MQQFLKILCFIMVGGSLSGMNSETLVPKNPMEPFWVGLNARVKAGKEKFTKDVFDMITASYKNESYASGPTIIWGKLQEFSLECNFRRESIIRFVAERIEENKVDLNAVDPHGETILHKLTKLIAEEIMHEEFMANLWKRQNFASLFNKDSSLMLWIKFVQLVVAKGANPAQANTEGLTPLDLLFVKLKNSRRLVSIQNQKEAFPEFVIDGLCKIVQLFAVNQSRHIVFIQDVVLKNKFEAAMKAGEQNYSLSPLAEKLNCVWMKVRTPFFEKNIKRITPNEIDSFCRKLFSEVLFVLKQKNLHFDQIPLENEFVTMINDFAIANFIHLLNKRERDLEFVTLQAGEIICTLCTKGFVFSDRTTEIFMKSCSEYKTDSMAIGCMLTQVEGVLRKQRGCFNVDSFNKSFGEKEFEHKNNKISGLTQIESLIEESNRIFDMKEIGEKEKIALETLLDKSEKQITLLLKNGAIEVDKAYLACAKLLGIFVKNISNTAISDCNFFQTILLKGLNITKAIKELLQKEYQKNGFRIFIDEIKDVKSKPVLGDLAEVINNITETLLENDSNRYLSLRVPLLPSVSNMIIKRHNRKISIDYSNL